MAADAGGSIKEGEGGGKGSRREGKNEGKGEGGRGKEGGREGWREEGRTDEPYSHELTRKDCEVSPRTLASVLLMSLFLMLKLKMGLSSFTIRRMRTAREPAPGTFARTHARTHAAGERGGEAGGREEGRKGGGEGGGFEQHTRTHACSATEKATRQRDSE